VKVVVDPAARRAGLGLRAASAKKRYAAPLFCWIVNAECALHGCVTGCSYAEDGDDMPSDVDMYGLELEEEEPDDFDDDDDDHKKKGRKKRRRRMNKVTTAVRKTCARQYKSRSSVTLACSLCVCLRLSGVADTLERAAVD
jgi:hypothetical protein